VREGPEITVNVNSAYGVEEGLVHLTLIDLALTAEVQGGILELCVGAGESWCI
jgi:hypothetical protein